MYFRRVGFPLCFRHISIKTSIKWTLKKVALILTRVLDFPISDSCFFLFVLFLWREGFCILLSIICLNCACTQLFLPTKIYLVKAMLFSVLMHGWDSWAMKKAEHSRVDAFELWCWRRFLRVPWTARISSQSILKEISPGTDIEAECPVFGHLM